MGGDDKGATYIYKRSGADWNEYLGNPLIGEYSKYVFGHSVSLSADGSYLAVGVLTYGASDNGAVYIYKRSGSSWVLQTRSVGENINDQLGYAVSLSANGSYLVVSAILGYSLKVGAAYIYKRLGSTWVLQLRLIGKNPYSLLGASVSLSANGSYLAVGARGEDNSAGATYTYNLEPTIGASPSATVERNTTIADGPIQIAESTDVYVYASTGATAQIDLTLPKTLTDGRILTIIFETDSNGEDVNITNSPVGYTSAAKAANDTIRLIYTLTTNSWYII